MTGGLGWGYQRRRLPELLRGVALARRLESHDGWDRSRIEGLQQRQLAETIEHAVAHSPFYRDRYRNLGAPGELRLADLPPLGRDELMNNFDDWVTDRRLRLDAIQGHLDELDQPDAYLLGEYRALTTGGSSGRKGVFVFSRREWSVLAALTLRWTRLIGVGARLPRRVRSATIAAGNPWHITFRVAVSVDVGLNKLLRLEATMPVQTLVDELNGFQPEWLHSYPSVAALLAQEQLSGQLNTKPRIVSTSSELRTEEMTQQIREAWDVEPYDLYGITEVGLFGGDCSYHRGVHAFDDLFIFEVADEHNQPVPDGEVGRKILATNLFNRTQPMIRYEIGDMIGISAERCPCGRPFPLLKSIEGRSDDMLELPDGRGGTVAIHPMHFRSPLARDPGVKQYQVVHRRDEIVLRVVPGAGAGEDELAGRLTDAVSEKLRAAGAEPPELRVEVVEAIERDPARMSKLKLVVSEVAPTDSSSGS